MYLSNLLLLMFAITIPLSGMQAPGKQSNLREDTQSYLSRLPRELYDELKKFSTNQLSKEEHFWLTEWSLAIEQTPQQIRRSPRVRCMLLHPNNNQIIYGSNSSIEIYDRQNGNHIKTLNGHTDFINCLALDIHNDQIISGSDDTSIKIWNFNGDCLHTLTGHTGEITRLAIDSQTNNLISCSFDGTLRIWDTRSGICLNTFNVGHIIYCIVLDSKRNQIIVGSAHSIIFVNCTTGQVEKRIESENLIFYLLLDSIQDRLFSFSASGRLKMWDLANSKCLKVLITDNVGDIMFNPQYNFIVCNGIGMYNTLIFDGTTGNLLHTIDNNYLKYPQAVIYDGVNDQIISAEDLEVNSGLITIWNLIDPTVKTALNTFSIEHRAAMRTLLEHSYQCFIDKKALDFNQYPILYETFKILPSGLQDTIKRLIKVITPLEFLQSVRRMW